MAYLCSKGIGFLKVREFNGLPISKCSWGLFGDYFYKNRLKLKPIYTI
jgi:hypothetical protein